jgi:hypothetical protein
VGGPRTIAPMVRRCTCVAALAVLTAMGASCGDDASAGAPTASAGGAAAGGGGTGGAAGAGGVPCVSGLVLPMPECTSCQDAHCCMSATAAANDPGAWTLSAAKICREANCWQECGVAQPECGGIVPTPASCADDLYAACCAEVTACALSDSCSALVYICVDDRGCNPGSACFNACALEFPGGEATLDAFIACFADVTCT